MKKSVFLVAAVVFASFATFVSEAQASNVCQLWTMPKIDSPPRQRELLILANDLDVSGNAGERLYVSNDKNYKLRVLRTLARDGESKVHFHGYQNDVLVLSTASSGNGETIGASSAVLLADGSAMLLICSIKN